MKKIVIITRNMHGGGAERVIAQLANYFIKEKIECDIVTLDNDRVLYEVDDKINIIPIGKKSDNKLKDKLARYSQVRKIVLKINPTVVLSMPEEIGIYVILALLGTRIPVYVSERNNPWVMPDVRITRILRTLMYPFAKGILFQTAMAQSFFPKYIQRKSAVIGNPVDADRIPQPYDGEREKMIVGAGRLAPQKNFALLISAFADFMKEHSDYSLCIYGEGQQREELEKLINNLGLLGKVKLPGRVDNLLERMNGAAMFVLSSDYEGMPNVLLEAMCIGMPVISTDCPSGGPRELIEDGVNGLLVPVNDEAALVQAMERLSSPNIAAELGENACKIREKLTSKDVFEQWYNYLF